MALDLTGIDLTAEVVRTDRLVLRPFRLDDVDAIVDACQDPEIQRWITALLVPCTSSDGHQFVTEIAMAGRAEGRSLTVAGD